jgi:carbon-monoxide dehydrogenase medium subunit
MQVRARGTIGGSLAHADPAADLPAAILALDAQLRASRLDGDGSTVAEREIAAADFFVDLLTTSLEPGEILTAIFVPDHRFSNGGGRSGSAYVKVRNKASHYALVGAAAVIGLGTDGVCNHAAIAVTGAAAKPFRLTSVENALKGTRAEASDLESALGTLSDLDVNWMADLHGSADYRRHLTGVVAARALQMARSRINS